jgi:hypothetical protein
MARQLSQVQGMRPSASGMRFPNARAARRVARADLTTVGSSDDTSRLGWTFDFCHGLSLLVPFLVLWIFTVLTPFIPNASLFWALQYPMSDFPKPYTYHLYPRNPTLHDTPTYFTVHTRHASILFSNHTLSYCINVSSLDHSPSRFVFHSLFPVRSVRFALILLFLALGCVSFLLLFVDIFDLCSPFLPLSFFSPPHHCFAG